MKKSAALMWLLGFLMACGSGGTPGAKFGSGVFTDAPDLGRDQGTPPTDLVMGKDAADTREVLVDMKVDLDSAITLDLDALDLLDALDRDVKPLDVLDTTPDTIQPCGGLCSQYQTCVVETGLCQDNELCLTDFCTGVPENTEKTEIDGKLTYVDKYEWPNQEGLIPQGGFDSVGLAIQTCLSVGKRLCTVAELSAACSPGSKYPYGESYDGTACNTELPYLSKESGSFAKCHAPDSGVFDLVGNLSEWTIDGKLFGGTVKDGLDSNCQKADDPAGVTDFALVGVRCCLSPTDDLDGDGTQASLDCNDLDKELHPGQTEICDDLDNDCDGQTDDAVDADNDGWNACDDCNDKAFSIHPGAADQLGDNIDANCDGIDGIDFDQDGVVAKESGGTDCDDKNPLVKPGEPDICDGIDNDCDGTVDSPLPEGACNDNSLCTNDSCDSKAKACVNKPIHCEDLSQCTDDTCDPAVGCVFVNNNLGCNDKNPCTESDQCLLGECRGQPKHCDDGKPCTDDSCDLATGNCKYTNNDKNLCEDADPCTTGDFCQGGICKAGAGTLTCNDNNDCTTDTCKPGEGCKYTERQGNCQDGDDCTVNDYCLNGVCTGGTNNCTCMSNDDCIAKEDGNWCNGTLICNLSKMPHLCEMKPNSIITCKPDNDTFCAVNTCKTSVGVCYPTPRNEGLACEKTCTIEPVCKEGTCQGTSCLAAGMDCAGGICISKTCTANTRICDGSFAYKTCNGTGNGWSSSTSCGTGQYCDGGQCKNQVCTPKAASCLGRLAGTCNDLGSNLNPGYTDCQTIPVTPFCKSGQCSACIPACTDKQCGDDGCGGTCGECGCGSICTAEGKCAFTACDGRQCGDNGCGGTCGSCISGANCNTQGRCTYGGIAGVAWVSIPAGTFRMGCSPGDNQCDIGEKPVHEVTLSAFDMLETEVTEGQYEAVTGSHPSCKRLGINYPVECVDWSQMKAFCETIGGRLPTEAQWEYAARGGTTTRYYCGDEALCLDGIAWFASNSANKKHPVKEKKGNAFGLFDMLGNVWERTNDFYGAYEAGALIDPSGPEQGYNRVLRGGGATGYGNHLRVSRRDQDNASRYVDDRGFRCARGATACVSTCTGKACGPDVCGGTCGKCPGNKDVCMANGQCCTPNCTGKVCGDDGCGGSCGACGAGQSCVTDRCVPVKARISAGASHACAVTSDSRLWCWGLNNTGNLGNGNIIDSRSPVQVVGLSDQLSVSSGNAHSCSLKSDGTAFCWGSNNYGQLGDGTIVDKVTPVTVKNLAGIEAVVAGGSSFTCALKNNGTVWCWGLNNHGQLGDGSTTDKSLPAQVPDLTGAIAITAGGYHACALKSDGSVWCWGDNGAGQLGDGTVIESRIPVKVTNLSGATAVSAGGQHTCVLKSTGTVWCWGMNGFGELGDGTKVNRSTPVQVAGLQDATAVAVGNRHICAAKNDGSVWCLGNNFSGQLGDGTTDSKTTPTKVKVLSTARFVTAGNDYSCALDSSGTAWCWGRNSNGQIGDGTTSDRLVPVMACSADSCGWTCKGCAVGGICNPQGRCTYPGTGGVTWVSIPGGTFQMGCSPGDTQCSSSEKPPHTVTVTAFQMLEAEVTEGQYQAVIGNNPSSSKLGASYPVENLNWTSAKAFCEAVGGRLASEAEWEYAGRGGTTTPYTCSDSSSSCLGGTAWYSANSGGKKQPVKGKSPNAYGLYDVLGNVWEWTEDWWHDSYTGAPTDGSGWLIPAASGRVIRGGCYSSDLGGAVVLRVTGRGALDPSLSDGRFGFRCARTPVTWTDPATNLTWQNPPASNSMNWTAATQYCTDLVLGGFEDWRLPSISELRSIIRGCPATMTGGSCGVTDSCLAYSTCWASGVCGGCTSQQGPDGGCYWATELEGPCSPNSYWSSSPLQDHAGSAYRVAFGVGAVTSCSFDCVGFSSVVRCVRNAL